MHFKYWNANLQNVNRIYLNKFVWKNYEFTQEELDLLWSIALITPQEGGDAVYIARAMLGIDPDDHDNVYYDITDQSQQADKGELKVSVYPNPVDDKLYIKINGDNINSDVYVEIFDISGRLISKESKGKNGYFFINTDALINGVYFIRVTDYNNINESHKIIVRH